LFAFYIPKSVLHRPTRTHDCAASKHTLRKIYERRRGESKRCAAIQSGSLADDNEHIGLLIQEEILRQTKNSGARQSERRRQIKSDETGQWPVGRPFWGEPSLQVSERTLL